MRIAHILPGRCNPNAAGGTEAVTYHLSREQALLGHQVGVWSLTNKAPLPLGDVVSSAVAPSKNPFIAPISLRRQICEFSPDIVHIHFVMNPACTAIGSFLHRAKIPYVVSPHGFLSPRSLRRHRLRKAAYIILFERRHLHNSSAIHALNTQEFQDLRNSGVVSPTFVVPNGVSVHDGTLDRNALSEWHPHLRQKRILLFLGRMDVEQKGLDLLIEALGNVRACCGELALVLVGPDWRGSLARIEALAKQAGISDMLTMLGPMFGSEKSSVLASADVFVHPSRWEGSPMSVLEAMSAGLPCLVTPGTNLSKFVRAHNAGLSASPTVESLSNALLKINDMTDEELAFMGKNAVKASLEHFQWAEIAGRIIDNYERILSTI